MAEIEASSVDTRVKIICRIITFIVMSAKKYYVKKNDLKYFIQINAIKVITFE